MDDLELIKSRINVVDLIQEYLPLKKTGINYKANCPFHHENTPSFVVSPERGIWHCFGCFPPGELIKTPFGYHAIETVRTDEYVVSGEGRYKKVLAIHNRNYSGDLITLTTRKLGRSVNLTGDHHVFIVRPPSNHEIQFKYFSRRYRKYLKYLSNRPEYYFNKVKKWLPIQEVEARNVKEGDLLLYPINNSIADVQFINLEDYVTSRSRLGPRPSLLPKLEVKEPLLKLLGYYIAEGSNHRAYIRFSLGNDEEDFAKEILVLIKELFGLEASIHYRSGKKSGIEVTVCHSVLANVFENLCGKHAENKHIPFIFQELPLAKQSVLLNAVHRGDGTQFVAHKSRREHKSITTISKILGEQLVDILLRLNYFPSFSVKKTQVDKKGVNHKESYSIFWSEEATLKYNLVYYHSGGSKYWLLPLQSRAQSFYKGPVHNLTIEGDHSYVASHIAVSNCGKGGDIFKFIAEKESVDFKEAVEILAQKAGVTLKRRKEKSSESERLFELNQKAQQFFHYILLKHPLGQKPLEYLKKRGLSDETIETFSLGYAPKSWHSLTDFLKKRGFKEAEIISSGLAVSSKNSCYDRFRGRIVFPLLDVRGRVIGFSGRVLDSSLPKYINTPQTPIFDKGKFLFGLHLAKGEIKEQKGAILVEGEMDMLMSYQSGVKNIVASKGTALTAFQIEALQKYTQDLLLCFDTDLAGDSASRRGIEMAESAGLNMKVIKIPEGKDPGELCLKSPDKWIKAVEKAKPIYDYYLESVESRYDLKTSSGKRGAFNELLPIWRTIKDTLTREHYIQKLAALLQIKEEVLREQLAKPQSHNFQAQIKSVSPASIEKKSEIDVKDRRELLEEYLIALLLHVPLNYTYIPNFPETLLTKELLRQIYVLLVLFLDSIAFKGKAFKISEFVKFAPVELTDQIDRLYLLQLDQKLEDSSHWQKEMDQVIAELKKMLIKSSLEKLSLQIKNAQQFDKIETLESLNKRFRDLSVKLKNF